MYCVEETNKKKTVSESESESYKLGTKTEEGKSTQHRNSKKRHTYTQIHHQQPRDNHSIRTQRRIV